MEDELRERAEIFGEFSDASKKWGRQRQLIGEHWFLRLHPVEDMVDAAAVEGGADVNIVVEVGLALVVVTTDWLELVVVVVVDEEASDITEMVALPRFPTKTSPLVES